MFNTNDVLNVLSGARFEEGPRVAIRGYPFNKPTGTMLRGSGGLFVVYRV